MAFNDGFGDDIYASAISSYHFFSPCTQQAWAAVFSEPFPPQGDVFEI
jgi:hypothetical protein